MGVTVILVEGRTSIFGCDAITEMDAASENLQLDIGLRYDHDRAIKVSMQVYSGWAKKRGHRLIAIILSNLNRFQKKFHWKILW